MTLPGEFTLQPGERIGLPRQATLRYVGVENDSRCPPDVQCIHAGDARVRFRFDQAGGSTDIALHTATDTPQPLGHWTLRLLDLEHGAAPAATVRIDTPPGGQ